MLAPDTFAQSIHYDIPDGFERDISKSQYKQLVDLSVEIISKRYDVESVSDGTITLKDGQHFTAFHLDNLIIKCHGIKGADFKKAIRDHFESLFSSIDQKDQLEVENFEAIRSYLSVRIYPEQFIKAQGSMDGFVFRTDLEGTYTLLMLDMPGAFTPVGKQFTTNWNKTHDELFLIAIENASKHPVEKVKHKLPTGDTSIELYLIGNEDYAASYLLNLEQNAPDLVGEFGAVVAVPNKGLVNLCKIDKDRSVDFVKFIQYTRSVIIRSYEQHAQPISTEYFWYYQGKFVRIPVEVRNGGTINVIAPPALSSLLTQK
jgi:hypothetical protein